MTIIVGIICKDAIVLASDSQTTCDGAKRTDSRKIVCVNFGSDKVLVAESGNTGTAERAIEILSELAKNQQVTDYRTPADLASKAMAQVKQELKQQYCNCTVTELQELIWKHELQSELMLAFYFNGKPYIFKAGLAVGGANKENSWYSTSGCGASLGSYLLTEHGFRGMGCEVATMVAAYVVETVCKHDAYCSPPTRVAVIINDIGEKAKNSDPTQLIHPGNFGLGILVIYTANTATSLAKKIDGIIVSERRNRVSKLERLAKQSKKKSQKLISEFRNAPKKKTFAHMAQAFKDISFFDHFKSK